MTATSPQFLKSGKTYYAYNPWRKTSGKAALQTDPFLFLQKSEPYLYAYSDDFLLKVSLAASNNLVAKGALEQAFVDLVKGVAISQNETAATLDFSHVKVMAPLWFGLPASIVAFVSSGSSTTTLAVADATTMLQVYAKNLKKTLSQQFCSTMNPTVNPPCRLLCEDSCDRTVLDFCSKTTTIGQGVETLDATLTALCSCIISPYGTWIAQELLKKGITDPSSPLQLLQDIPCYDANECRNNGFRTAQAKEKLATCPTLCANTVDIQTLQTKTSLNNLIQSCTVDQNSKKPIVMLFKETLNTISRQGVAVVQNGEANTLTFQLTTPTKHNSLLATATLPPPAPSTLPPLKPTLNHTFLYLLIGGGVGICVLFTALLVWWFV